MRHYNRFGVASFSKQRRKILGSDKLWLHANELAAKPEKLNAVNLPLISGLHLLAKGMQSI